MRRRKGRVVTDEAGPWLVVGLGNPGREYAGNRHNVGFMVAESAGRADRCAVRPAPAGGGRGRRGRGSGSVAPKLVLVKPLTYMNLSGGPVAALAQFYKVPIDAGDRGARRAGHPVRAAAGQVRRRRGRPQRAAVDVEVAGHEGLRPGAVRHRPTAGAAGPGRLRAVRLLARPSARSWISWWTGRPTWWSRSSPGRGADPEPLPRQLSRAGRTRIGNSGPVVCAFRRAATGGASRGGSCPCGQRGEATGAGR